MPLRDSARESTLTRISFSFKSHHLFCISNTQLADTASVEVPSVYYGQTFAADDPCKRDLSSQ